MKWTPATAFASLAVGAIVVPVGAHAKVYASVEQAQKGMFGESVLALCPVL